MRVIFAFRPAAKEISAATELFGQIDLDKDGFISKDDVKVFLRQFDVKITKNNLDVLAEVRISSK